MGRRVSRSVAVLLFVLLSLGPAAARATSDPAGAASSRGAGSGKVADVSPQTAQSLFQAAKLSSADVPGATGAASEQSFDPAALMQINAAAGQAAQNGGAVAGFGQLFSTGLLSGAADEIAVFNTAGGAGSWYSFLSTQAVAISSQYIGRAGVTFDPATARPLDMPRLGDQSIAVEIPGTLGVQARPPLSGAPAGRDRPAAPPGGPLAQSSPFIVDLGMVRRGQVHFAAAVVRPGSGTDGEAILRQMLITLDGKVAGAMNTLGLGAPTAPSATYPAGWNLVSGPAGTSFTGATAGLFTLGPGDAGYRTVDPASGVAAGAGYWAYFPASTTVLLSGTSAASATVQAPAGQYVMIGNPSATQTLRVSGADSVLVFDPVAGQYSSAASLSPGQGAWAYSANGGTIAIGP